MIITNNIRSNNIRSYYDLKLYIDMIDIRSNIYEKDIYANVFKHSNIFTCTTRAIFKIYMMV